MATVLSPDEKKKQQRNQIQPMQAHANTGTAAGHKPVTETYAKDGIPASVAFGGFLQRSNERAMQVARGERKSILPGVSIGGPSEANAAEIQQPNQQLPAQDGSPAQVKPMASHLDSGDNTGSGARIIRKNGQIILTNVSGDNAVMNEVNNLRDRNVAAVIDGQEIRSDRRGGQDQGGNTVDLQKSLGDNFREINPNEHTGKPDHGNPGFDAQGNRIGMRGDQGGNVDTIKHTRNVLFAGQDARNEATDLQAQLRQKIDADPMAGKVIVADGGNKSRLGRFIDRRNQGLRESKDHEAALDRQKSVETTIAKSNADAANKTYELSPGEKAVNSRGQTIATGGPAKEANYPDDVMAFFQQDGVDEFGNKVTQTDTNALSAFQRYYSSAGGQSRDALASFQSKVNQLQAMGSNAQQWVTQQIQARPDARQELEALYQAAFPTVTS